MATTRFVVPAPVSLASKPGTFTLKRGEERYSTAGVRFVHVEDGRPAWAIATDARLLSVVECEGFGPACDAVCPMELLGERFEALDYDHETRHFIARRVGGFYSGVEAMDPAAFPPVRDVLSCVEADRAAECDEAGDGWEWFGISPDIVRRATESVSEDGYGCAVAIPSPRKPVVILGRHGLSVAMPASLAGVMGPGPEPGARLAEVLSGVLEAIAPPASEPGSAPG
jgi:hypothetical protein